MTRDFTANAGAFIEAILFGASVVAVRVWNIRKAKDKDSPLTQQVSGLPGSGKIDLVGGIW